MYSQQQILQQQLSNIRPLLHAVEAALTTGAWHTAREQAAACLASLQPTPSSVPGLAVRLLLLQATASAHLQHHDDSIQVQHLPPCRMQMTHLQATGWCHLVTDTNYEISCGFINPNTTGVRQHGTVSVLLLMTRPSD
jgi:hypothetical protein